MEKIFTVAILGIGARGADVYGPLMHIRKDKFDIVSFYDKNDGLSKRVHRYVDKKGNETPSGPVYPDGMLSARWGIGNGAGGRLYHKQ